MPKRDMPEWDGFGNKFEWILEQAKRLREERNGHLDRTRNLPDLRLYVCGRLVDMPKVPVRGRALVQRFAASHTASVTRIENTPQPPHTAVKKTGA